jgi:Na+-transporting NADH:ubiquinone oxidoreductase subunit B
MKDPLRSALDKIAPVFDKGQKLERAYPLFEALDTFLYTPGEITKGASHVRDSLDNKRLMITVAVALTPCILMAMMNTGYQANLAINGLGLETIEGWRGAIINALGIGFNPSNVFANLFHGALYFLPVFLVCNIAGGIAEVIFSVVRKHEINEGFLVTGMLFPLTLPPTIPLWQVAVGILFGVIVGKEVFGGVGKNFLNPALTARAFLFFAYPAEISGDAVWTAVDGFTGATPLGVAAFQGLEGVQESVSWFSAFVGTIPGSMGETSTLACLLGALILVATGIGSWKIMVSMFLGGLGAASLLFAIGSDSNPMFSLPFHWHFVLGGFAFGMVFMVTDPVSAAMTSKGKWIYGALVGVMSIVVRSLNPAFPEGVMLAILFGNTFAPLIDYFVVKGAGTRRKKRLEQRRSQA